MLATAISKPARPSTVLSEADSVMVSLPDPVLTFSMLTREAEKAPEADPAPESRLTLTAVVAAEASYVSEPPRPSIVSVPPEAKKVLSPAVPNMWSLPDAALDVFDAGQRIEPGRRGERVSGAAARVEIDIGAAGACGADIIGIDAVAAVDGLVARLRDEVARDDEADMATVIEIAGSLHLDRRNRRRA